MNWALAISVVCYCSAALNIFWAVRSHFVHKARIQLIDLDVYEYQLRMPPFGATTYHPKYYHLWTFNQWKRWMRRQRHSFN